MVTIYKICPDYEGYSLASTDTDAFLSQYSRLRALQRLRSEWKKLTFYVHDPVWTKEMDFYHLSTGIVAFRQRVYESNLGEQLDRCGDVLPAVREDNGEEFYVLNPLACFNCLNRAMTKLRTTPDGKTVVQIFNYAFHPNRIGGESVFRIPETHLTELYASSGVISPDEEFYHQYQANGFSGLKFNKLWAEGE